MRIKRLLSALVAAATILSAAGSVWAIDTIQKGDQSDVVKEIQQILIDAGYLSGEADGTFGMMTEEAVLRFQKEHGLDATGIVGEATYKTLLSLEESDNDSQISEPETDAATSKALQIEVSSHTDTFSSEAKFAVSIYQMLQKAGRQSGAFKQNHNPEASFDTETQTAEIVRIYLTYSETCDAASAREVLEEYTDKLIQAIVDSYPNVIFEILDICWQIPSIDKDSLYAATYWCEPVEGAMTRKTARGIIYQDMLDSEDIDIAGEEEESAVSLIQRLTAGTKSISTETAENEYEPVSDATLSYEGDTVMVFTSEEAMSRFTKAIINDLQGTIQEMLQSGEAMPVPKGTKCNIIKTKLSRCQVKLVDGEHAGESVWVVIEAVKR